MRFSYLRVSDLDQSVAAQRQALGASDEEFLDEGISGAVAAHDRPGFSAMFVRLRAGDVVSIYAIDRLGRDAIDVQATVRRLMDAGVIVDVYGLGAIGRGVGELIVAVLAQVADMERHRIKERCNAGRIAARAALATTGRTQHGKLSLGRPMAADRTEVVHWRERTGSSISMTADRFNLSVATVKRYTADARKAASLTVGSLC